MPGTTPPRDGWLIVLYGILLLAGILLLTLGLIEAAHTGSMIPLGLGVLAITIPCAAYPILSAVRENAADPRVAHLLESINQRMLISDAAKRIAYREQDRNALREAIRQDIARRDFDAALVLVQDMANAYGYREEAEIFRAEILAARKADMDAKIDQAIAALDMLLQRRLWDQAAEEAAKIMRLYPESPRAKELDQRVKDAKGRYKQDLEDRFLQSAQRDEVDAAMELLKELDPYLSGDEATRLREVARAVVSKKRENLGVQFKLAVHDKDWAMAKRIGEQIMREFPNTRMADEVRNMIDLLKQRAGEAG